MADDKGEGVGEDDIEMGLGIVLRAVKRVLVNDGEPRSTSTSTEPSLVNLEGSDPSGVNSPFSHLPELLQLLSLPLEDDPMELRRLSFEVFVAAKAIPTNALVDALGLGMGDAVGVRRGEGSGNN